MPILGLGFDLRKQISPPFRCILDDLNKTSSCVLAFSYKLLTRLHTGYCVEVMRGSDFSTQWFGFKNGYIDRSGISDFCNGTTGKVRVFVNQSQVVGVQNAVQVNWANMPIIYEGGQFYEDGLKFVFANACYMTIAEYAAIDITNPPLSVFASVRSFAAQFGYYILCKNYASTSDNQYSVYNANAAQTYFKLNSGIYLNILGQEGIDKILAVWKDKNTNGVYLRNVINTGYSTNPDSLVSSDYVTLGARSNDAAGNRSSFLNEYVKTVLMFNTNEINNYSRYANGGI